MDDSDKSLKFEIDPDQIEAADKKADKVRRIEGRTVIIRRADGKKPPPVKYNLDEKKKPKPRTRRQMAKDMARKSGELVDEDAPPPIDKISFIRRGVGFGLDLGFALLALALIYFFYEEKLIAYHLQLMNNFDDTWRVYSDLIYMIQIFLPVYLVVFFLPVLFFEASIGKRLVGFKIRQVHGASANFDQLILRELFRPLSCLTLIGLLIGVFSPYRTLHDRVSRTKLVLV